MGHIWSPTPLHPPSSRHIRIAHWVYFYHLQTACAFNSRWTLSYETAVTLFLIVSRRSSLQCSFEHFTGKPQNYTEYYLVIYQIKVLFKFPLFVCPSFLITHAHAFYFSLSPSLSLSFVDRLVKWHLNVGIFELISIAGSNAWQRPTGVQPWLRRRSWGRASWCSWPIQTDPRTASLCRSEWGISKGVGQGGGRAKDIHWERKERERATVNPQCIPERYCTYSNSFIHLPI